VSQLHCWANRFNDAFHLRVPRITLGIDRLSCSRLGQFRPGHNGLGLEAEIVINKRHVPESETWQVLGTLLHELLHGWQQVYGRPGRNNYHNVQYRRKAQSLGLVVDKYGHTHYEAESPFTRLLREHGVELARIEQQLPHMAQPVGGSSKLKKWTCGCTNVRVAVADFHAQCLKCGGLFCIVDSPRSESISRRWHC
jgi:hypothetical protein